MTENEIAKEIVDAAFKIHTALGPGLLESVYEAVLTHELRRMTQPKADRKKIGFHLQERHSPYMARVKKRHSN